MRKVFFWLHLAVGCLAGIVILVLSLTGVLLGFERQINSWSDSRTRIALPAPGAAMQPLEQLQQTAQAAMTKGSGQSDRLPPPTIAVHARPLSPLEFSFGRDHTLLVNPYTSEVLGEQPRGTREFFSSVEKIHRALGGALRNSWGRSVVDASNFVFLFLVVSGIYLWIPKRWAYKYVRPALLYRGGLAGRARDWNWHNVTGIWSAIPLFFIVLTGVIMSYAWANNLLYQATGTQPPPPGRPPEAREQGRAGERRGGGRADADSAMPSGRTIAELLGTVERQTPDWRTISFQLPRRGNTVTFTVDTGTGGQPQRRWTKTLDRATAATLHQEGFENLNAGRKLRTIARFLHTGEILGLPGQIVATAASLGGMLLVWTGLSLAVRRWTRWRTRRTSGVTEAEALSNLQTALGGSGGRRSRSSRES